MDQPAGDQGYPYDENDSVDTQAAWNDELAARQEWDKDKSATAVADDLDLI